MDRGYQLVFSVLLLEHAETAASKVSLQASRIVLTRGTVVILLAGQVVVRVEVAPLLLGLKHPLALLIGEVELRVFITQEASLRTNHAADLVVPDSHRQEDRISRPLVLLRHHQVSLVLAILINSIPIDEHQGTLISLGNSFTLLLPCILYLVLFGG